MSLYDDYKKSSKPNKEVEKNLAKAELEKDEELDKDLDSEEVAEGDQINIKDEIYEIQKEPFYKRKEFYILCTVALIIIALLFFLLYVPSFKMENLLGKDESYAQSYAKNYDLELAVVEDYSDEYSVGQIYAQSLTADEEYKQGVVLQVNVSKGPNFEMEIDYPDFSSMSYDEAVEWKRDNFAKGTELVLEESNVYENGAFIREEIGEVNKQDFKRSSTIRVVYSRGEREVSDTVVMDDLSSKSVTEVADWAHSVGLKLEVKEIFDDYLTQGVVLEQSIAPGESVKKGVTFNVTISVGPGVVVPNFTSVSQIDAGSVASSAGVNMVEQSVYHSTVAKGRMISQCTPAGTKIGAEDVVTVRYSLGKVPIPDFTETTYLDLVSSIDSFNESGANIKVEVTYVTKEGYGKGIVVGQTHINSLVKTGTTIKIEVTK